MDGAYRLGWQGLKMKEVATFLSVARPKEPGLLLPIHRVVDATDGSQ